MRFKRRHKNLLAGPCLPQSRIGLIDQPCIWNNPLSVETTKGVARRGNDLSLVSGDRKTAKLVPAKSGLRCLGRIFVAQLAVTKVRMKQFLSLRLLLLLDQPIPALLQRLLVRRNDPRPPRHDA